MSHLGELNSKFWLSQAHLEENKGTEFRAMLLDEDLSYSTEEICVMMLVLDNTLSQNPVIPVTAIDYHHYQFFLFLN